MSGGDIVTKIKARVDPADYALNTAEGRAAFDNALRDELTKIADPSVRAHAGEMLRLWRLELFGLPNVASLESLLSRLDALEQKIGVKRQSRTGAVEIRRLKGLRND